MSDTEHHSFDDTRYSTPVPELDDHRAQAASVQKPTRSRRGTADTLYLAARRAQGPDLAHVNEVLRQEAPCDIDEAIIDEENPQGQRSRRPTVTTISSRSNSPPNSVKAFAAARERNREDDHALQRTFSSTSRRSHHTFQSRRFNKENDAVGDGGSSHAAEDDVCFPQQAESRNPRNLNIDYELLEKFIASEERDLTPPKNQPKPRVFNEKIFHDLSKNSSSTPQTYVTVDGDLIKIPSNDFSVKEKSSFDSKNEPAHRPDQRRFTFFNSEWESVVHAPEFKDLLYDGENVRGLFDLPDDDNGVWWLNISNPTNQEINVICKSFGIHPLTSEDIKTQEAREKIELFPSYYFACFRSFHTIVTGEGENQQSELEPFNIYVVVFREGTLSFSFSPNVHADNVYSRIKTLKNWLTLSSDWICYALIDDVVDTFVPSINKIEAESDAIEDSVFIARSDDMRNFLRRIGEVRKNCMGMMKLLGGKADVLRGFTKRCNENYGVTPKMDIGLYLGDIQDHVVTMMSNLNHFEKMLSRSHSNYLAQLSIDNILQGNQSNKVLNKVTVLASILVPLNLVCGAFGMNVKVPFRDSESLLPFFMIILFIVTFSVASFGIARRMRWV